MRKEKRLRKAADIYLTEEYGATTLVGCGLRDQNEPASREAIIGDIVKNYLGVKKVLKRERKEGPLDCG